MKILNNLKGLEIEFVYKWRLGDLFIFDRTHLTLFILQYRWIKKLV